VVDRRRDHFEVPVEEDGIPGPGVNPTIRAWVVVAIASTSRDVVKSRPKPPLIWRSTNPLIR
jgi:hypothetical protein